MTPIDDIISDMNNSGCNYCRCESAVLDETPDEAVRIAGSFCYDGNGTKLITITAFRKSDGKEVWEKDCDTGQTCSIPFTLIESFICSPSPV